MFPRLALLLLFALAALAAPLQAGARKTVCTITVNSADEKDAFRDRLPKGDYDFVELVDKGRPDWLRTSCQRGVQCDVLIVSGHFNAGDDFYSDRLENREFLSVDELERASCSESCPGVFARLKEVHLYGCESLNASASHNGTGESSRERMRRLFAGVPVIYGFASSAPVGATAAMLLNRAFDAGFSGEVATGRPSSKLLAHFTRNSMTVAPGLRAGDRAFPTRAQACQFFDERRTPAQKLRFVHESMRRDLGQARGWLERIEKLLASLDDAQRQSPDFTQALAEVSADEAVRERFLALAREDDAPRRARMIALAATLGWLSPVQHRAEKVALVQSLFTRTVGYAGVDLVCALNAGGELNGAFSELSLEAGKGTRAGHFAALACLGSPEAHGQVLRALASPVDAEVQAAQAYLRHRPLTEASEVRVLAREIARMPASVAQVRALEALARLRIADPAVLEELGNAFAIARSLQVQRAIAEVFIRSDPAAIDRPEMVAVIRQHRLKSPGGREDLIDVLVRRLEGS